MIEQVSRLRHPTEAMSLAVYNEVFSSCPVPGGTTCYYDAAADFYGDRPPSRASEARVGMPRMRLLSFD